MDFELDERQKELRREFEEFCLDEDNRRILAELADEGDYYNAHSWELFKKMAERGWISLNWPVEYGGRGYTPEEMMRKWTELTTDNPLNQRGFEITERAIKTGKRQKPYLLELKR
ncbi:MAG: acyl-CoA dehydrogenase family protein, partial [Actinobacteria bacterium]|nr:acyl-CoA dehydrogenase family protein [Actinomycetota bacterium]